MRFPGLLIALLVSISVTLGACGKDSSQNLVDWREDWAVREGFEIQVDTSGFQFPTAIAFVKDPGSDPNDPLYFVTELRGLIKVVTNDRSVHTFADVPSFHPGIDLPSDSAHVGLAGLCLDPTNGYLFVTYSAPDESGLLRNHIRRFDTDTQRFATTPTAVTEIARAVSIVQSAPSHQIGGCVVADDSLYVGIGDGGEPRASQRLDDPRGKVLRVTFDGESYAENPFFGVGGSVAPMVWAFGLRNPFGLTHVNGQVFVADNGPSLDRFLQLRRGQNYRWDGTNDSMGLQTDVAFAETIGPVHVAYVDGKTSPFFQGDSGGFYVAMSASGRGNVGLKAIPYAISDRPDWGTPYDFVKYTGPISTGGTGVAAVALGPDGVYFANILPGLDGETRVLKVTPDVNGGYPLIIGKGGSGPDILTCRGCHFIEGQGGQVGPSLELQEIARKSQLRALLASDEFRAKLVSMNKTGLDSLNEMRQQVLNANDEELLFTYVRNKILEPRFADELAQMPNLGIEPAEAERIAAFLLDGSSVENRSFVRRILLVGRNIIPTPPSRSGDIIAGVVLGLAAAFGIATAVGLIVWLRRRNASVA